MQIISCRGLGYGFPSGRVLLKGLDLDLESHELLLIGGPNGVGKSTFLQIVLGFPPAIVQGGSIELHVPLDRVAWIPQLENPEFHLPLTLRDVLDMNSKGKFDPESALSIGLLKPEHLNHSWNQASGGERKRVLLTRALLHRPSLLLLDEPMNHLDPESRALIVEALSRYLRETDAAAVVVSHDILSGQELSPFRRKTLYIDTARFHLESFPERTA